MILVDAKPAHRAPLHDQNPTRQIIFVNRFFFPDQSATSRLLSDLACTCAAEGRTVSVITSRGLYDDPAANLPAIERYNRVAIHRVYRPRFSRSGMWGRAMDYAMMYGAFTLAVWRLAQNGDCLVVKTDPPLMGAMLAPIAHLKQLRLVNWLQDIYPEVALVLGVHLLKPVAPALLAFRNAGLKTATRNVVVSDRMRDKVQLAGAKAESIELILNWCDDEAILPIDRQYNELRRQWGLNDKFVIGYSGNLGRAHECDTLIAAATKLRSRNDICFLFIGGGYRIESLKRDVRSKGLEASFRFAPYQPDDALSQSLCVPDVHWLSQPAEMEGLILPSKFYGIAAAGRPILVIGDPNGELAQLVDQHKCGAAIDIGDASRFATLVEELKADPARCERMGSNARSLLEAGLTRQHALSRWRTLLDSV